MRRVAVLVFLGLWVASPVEAASPPPSDAARWWAHVEFLASDALEGRATGSEGHRKAAAYVADTLSSLGVKPAFPSGYTQEMSLRSRRLVEEKSRLALMRDGRETALMLGQDAILVSRTGMTGSVDAPLVFVGQGLSMPEAGHDDFASLDLRGKVAVILVGGGPRDVSGVQRAHHASWTERAAVLERLGAVGVVLLQNPKFLEVPWERTAAARKNPAMLFADPALQEGARLKVQVTVNAQRASVWFEGAPHSYAELVALANDGKPLPKFELPWRLRATLDIATEPVTSVNVVGVLPGADPVLAREYVIVSAHLDHLGVGEPVRGDRIYNGAMDNASGVAAVLEVARALAQAPVRPRRTVLFALVTGEEKGLLGSRYLARHLPVPGASCVADLNLDMFLPLVPFTHVVALGMNESSLIEPLRRVASERGVKVLADPEPDRLLFVRSDQYSFVREGIPALAFKFGYEPGSTAERLMKQWFPERYHAPSDDVRQPVDREGAARFVQFLSALTRAVADAAERPRWNDDSFFRRFATSPSPREAGAR
ncbi:M20/M25/M40 family metallo-hydrolase [Corallococcus sp. M34]|uniref:M28 family metallopeptidase n=1 Tax=Citreicoccus inhibens TaxID=2849499 RepID=UPI001C221EE0|nr:M28 family metallopeptidase [Citreicoccus inhibens]MBU8900392.1 M20/M25/M40 family metallo-hydrolase [Citreicoccus inhibens]